LRVAKAIAGVEKKNRQIWAECFFEMMGSCRFMPNSPTLMNAGKSEGQLSACYVLPIEDSLESIFDGLKSAAKIHQSGGGTGFSFSRLRPKGSPVRSSNGVASGPVSFMKIFDVATETIKQGGTRRGANMAVLNVDHPDIFEFIEVKLDLKSMTNFNLSVGITDEFMLAVRQSQAFWLRDPKTGQRLKEIDAKKLFYRLSEAAWRCADPGLVFLDRMNLFNPTPLEGAFECTNPCGEQPLLPYESCNLGSLNLGAYCRNRKFNWELFQKDIHLAVRFLDNVIDANVFPLDPCRKITLKNRKIGLGVMGFADLLLKMGIPYVHEEAVKLGEKVMSFLNQQAKAASAELAKKRGAFPNWKKSLWAQKGVVPLRNATVSTVAPTGTISMIAGASSGIEPIFSAVFFRNVLNGKRLLEIHPAVQELILEKGLSVDGVTDELVAKELGDVWCPAQKVPFEVHVKVQAAFQRHSDSAVSKTINFPQSATVEDVAQAYLLAYELGCKGITVYRDQSRPTQVLENRNSSSGEGQICPSC